MQQSAAGTHTHKPAQSPKKNMLPTVTNSSMSLSNTEPEKQCAYALRGAKAEEDNVPLASILEI